MPAQNRFWHDLCQGLITWCQDNWEVAFSLKKSRETFCRVSIFQRSARWCNERSLIGLDSSMKIWSSDKRLNSLPESSRATRSHSSKSPLQSIVVTITIT